MAKNINLMPSEAVPKESTVKIVKVLRTIDIIGSLIFFVGVLAIISIFIINSEELRQSNIKQNTLRASIKRMEKEEQQYVLLKDRSEKIQGIISSVGAMKEMENFDNLKSMLPTDATFSTVNIKRGATETTIAVRSYSSLAKTLATLTSSGLYKGIIMSNFTFSSEGGYLLSLKLSS